MATREALVEAVLNRLRSALGTGETPPGSNHNFITEWYNEAVAKIGNGPWCEMTQTWAMWTAGAATLKQGRAYTVWAAQDGQKGVNGSSFNFGTVGMMAGDAVYYDWSGAKGNLGKIDHVETVEKINGDGTFYTLAGNVDDKLQRMHRDGKYVVGYVRFAWERLADAPSAPPATPAPPPPSHPVPDRDKTSRIQSALEVGADGKWGPATDARAMLLRTAARAHVGWPSNEPVPFDIRTVQAVVNTTADGVWGPKSQAALVAWVKRFQAILGVAQDGQWGPNTDGTFLQVRLINLNNY